MPKTPTTRKAKQELSLKQKKERFLKELKNRANVSAAARKAKVGRRTTYTWYESDPDFAKEWDEALEEAVDGLEEAAWTRAKDGTLRPVYQGGQEVGAVREYSDTLMITLLKAHRPTKFKDRMDVTSGDDKLEQSVHIYLPDNGRNNTP